MPDEIPTISSNQARGLGDRVWQVNGTTFRFGPYAGGSFQSGKEAVTCPLYDQNGAATAYFKLPKKQVLSSKRVERTKWLIDQRLETWCPELKGTPRQWLDTRVIGRPQGFAHDFVCCLAGVAPGESWERIKEKVHEGADSLDSEFRLRCVRSLLAALARLEHGEIIHGDLSPGNIIVDRSAVDGNPALYLIDLDAFVAPRAGALGRLSLEEGGVYGTDGYCPRDLEQLEAQQRQTAAPYSDRHARDMLLLELLCFDQGCPVSDPPWKWPRELVERRLKQNGLTGEGQYLLRRDLFEVSEQQRPPSRTLAQAFGARVPPQIKRRQTHTTSTRRTAARGISVEGVFPVVAAVLWLLCAGLWSVVAFTAADWLVGAGSGLFAFGMRWFARIGLLLAGVITLSTLVLAGREPTLVEVGPVTLRFPARKDRTLSETRHRVFVIWDMMRVVVVLSTLVWVITRLRG